MHCIAGEGLGQKSDALKVDHAHLVIRINEEVALVHIGLGEDGRLVAETDLLRPTVPRNPFKSLIQVTVSGWRLIGKVQKRGHTLFMYLCNASLLEKGRGAI